MFDDAAIDQTWHKFNRLSIFLYGGSPKIWMCSLVVPEMASLIKPTSLKVNVYIQVFCITQGIWYYAVSGIRDNTGTG